MILIPCRQCHEQLEAPESMMGEVIECPKCGTNSRVGEIEGKGLSAATSTIRKQNSMFSGMLGNASEMDLEQAQSEVSKLLLPYERVELAYRLVRDLFVFTDRRLILVDKQGITGKKTEYHTIPYASIIHFSIETAGTFDLDAELRLYLSGSAHPIEKQFRKGGADIFAIQQALASAVLG